MKAIAKTRLFDGQVYYLPGTGRKSVRLPAKYLYIALAIFDLIMLWVMVYRPDWIIGGF